MAAYGAKEVIVVGAGLSGLTAALNLARGGKDVTVLDKFDRVGGMPQAHPAVDVTPLEPGPLGRFIGVELGEPEVTPCERWNMYPYDYKVPMDVRSVNLHCVQRGSHKTALDMLLYNACLDAGVTFEFNHPLVGQGDFAALPPDTVIATGLYFEAFEAFHIPYQKVFGYLGRGKCDPGATCAVWFNDAVLDYAYFGASGGMVFVLYFAREPVKDSEFDRFVDEQLWGQEHMRCATWDYHEGLVPTAEYSNPRMFVGDKILAGTLSGMMDPFALFGVHGSLVSGRIAAMAHLDKSAAFDLFKRYTRYFNRNLFARRVFDGTPVGFKKRVMGPQLQFVQQHAEQFKPAMNNFFRALPGYQNLP
ncbi:MAG: FAD-dependent oxidoreductase [Actinobacteria bacterium]|nr:FAD-dependent oxidoreductase [Actinomycetota bacterium]MBU1942765.1 FAD-dependent oxidoreductase [Actinomycetota bacterium]MBU2686087.1 FAD-dependent oxidoreductase [Actinomycetota bacterium]